MSGYFDKFGKNSFRRLETDSKLTPEPEQAIDVFMHHINFEDGKTEDCYRSEILIRLKDARGRCISIEEYERLKDYYVNGGIYKVKASDE